MPPDRTTPDIRPFDGKRPQIAPGAWLDRTAVVIGDVRIADGASLWPYTVARGDIHRIEIGSDSNVQDGTVLHVTHPSRFHPDGFPLQIGERVTVGHRVTLHGCTIGDGCLIGMDSTVMDGALLEPRVMLGARSLVPPGKRLDGGWLWRGAPATRARPLTDGELDYLEYVAQNYVRLAERYRAAGQ